MNTSSSLPVRAAAAIRADAGRDYAAGRIGWNRLRFFNLVAALLVGSPDDADVLAAAAAYLDEGVAR